MRRKMGNFAFLLAVCCIAVPVGTAGCQRGDAADAHVETEPENAAEVSAEESSDLPALSLEDSFTAESRFQQEMGSGDVEAYCEPEQIGAEGATLTVTIANRTGEALEISNEEPERLEQKRDGIWYSKEIETPEAVAAVCQTLPEGETEKEYLLEGELPAGTYRVLYRFLGDWCSGVFEVE